ncbi:MAG: hypothetical protein JXM71_09400, partial [Spirochaetales bacterium]|nr:hypothetical protein [Spirochaetales bacterium]
MRSIWRTSIGVRFSIITLLLVFLIMLAFSIHDTARSYEKQVNLLNHQLEQIQHSHLPFLVSSLWLTDYDLLQQQLEAIVRFPYTDRVEVEDDEGNVFHAGTAASDGAQMKSQPLVYTRRGTELPIGTLR